MKRAFLELIRTLDMNTRDYLFDLSENFSFTTLLLLLGIAFLYGIVHSAGPGHGKSLVLSYFMKDKHPITKSLFLSMIISVIHTGSAILISLVLTYIITGMGIFFRMKLQRHLMLISGIMIIIVGIVFLILKIIKKDEVHINQRTKKNIFAVGFAAGIVPCPVAMTIMFFVIPRNLVFYGIIIVTAISLGMFVLLSTVGIVGIKSRDAIIGAAGRGKIAGIVGNILEYGSVIFIILIGIMMTLSMAGQGGI